jgi:adenosine deaminase
MITDAQNKFIQAVPKAELHLHIEGSFEPELLFKIAERNGISIKYKTVEKLRNAYHFNNLQEFLDIYYEGANVLLHEQDFYDLTFAYLEKCREQNVVHTELFFDPQTHTQRGVSFETVVNGIQKALDKAKKEWGITSRLIPNFLRHLSEQEAIKTFNEALQFRELFIGFGLDSSEKGNPPAKFERVFKMAHDEGFLTVAHAGEEGSAQNVWDALRLLKVARIDHGVRSVDDAILLDELARTQTPLTVCPLSNLKLKVVQQMKDLPLRTLLEKNILVTINSDDPAYFGGYVNENYKAITEAFNLTKDDLRTLAKNSFKASFMGVTETENWIKRINEIG